MPSEGESCCSIQTDACLDDRRNGGDLNLTAAELRALFQERVKLSSPDLNEVADSFSDLYRGYQDEVVQEVTVESVNETP
ncbi:MAG: hypothetical protein GY768_26350 [Planctomycetaceae bacterium]|nr:hypothetical protein [Planctomycetaceae bacterium]